MECNAAMIPVSVTLGQTPAYTAKPRRGATASCGVPAKARASALEMSRLQPGNGNNPMGMSMAMGITLKLGNGEE